MTDTGGPTGSGGPGEASLSPSSSSRSPAEACIVIALAAGIVAMAFHHDVTGLEALGALAALAVPESPGSAVRRLLGRSPKE